MAKYETREAIAAPVIPNGGIRAALRATFKEAPIRLAHISVLVLPMVTKVPPFAPKKVLKANPTHKIRNAVAAPVYSMPKRKFNMPKYDDKIALRHMLDHAREAVEMIAGKTPVNFIFGAPLPNFDRLLSLQPIILRIKTLGTSYRYTISIFIKSCASPKLLYTL